MVGRVGRDLFAEMALRGLRQIGVDITCVGQSTQPTACASVQVADDGENAIVVSSGAKQAVTTNQASDSMFTPDTTVLLQMEVPLMENWAFLQRAHGAVRCTILNAAPTAFVPDDAMKQLDILIVNEGEGAAITAQAGLTASSLCCVPRQLAQRYELNCILTLGAEAAIVAGSGNSFSVDAASVTPLDTTGASDTFVGVLAAGLDGGMDLRTSATRASLAVSLACTVIGAQISIPTASVIDANSHLLPKIKTLS